MVKFVSADELLKRLSMTREEWNDEIARRVKELEADPTLPEEQKGKMIANLLMQTITKNNHFLFEELLEGW